MPPALIEEIKRVTRQFFDLPLGREIFLETSVPSNVEDNEKMDKLRRFVQAIPKVELHVHLEGALSANTLVELARKHGISLPHDGAADRLFDFQELEDFFLVYELACQSMRDRSDFYRVTYETLRRCAESNARYVEFFFNPQTHLSFGVSYAEMLAGIVDAMTDVEAAYGLRSGVIPAYDRRLGPEPGAAFLDMVLGERPKEVIGIGIDYLEHPHNPAVFEAMYARARHAGLGVTAHVGFRGPAEHVWEAVDVLGCRRIDHGYHIVDDPALMARCRDAQVGFTCCPTSALMASVWRNPDALDHPIRRMVESGLIVTVNTDDPGLFRTSLNDEFMILARHMNVDCGMLGEIALNGLRMSWLDSATRHAAIGEWTREINELLRTFDIGTPPIGMH